MSAGGRTSTVLLCIALVMASACGSQASGSASAPTPTTSRAPVRRFPSLGGLDREALRRSIDRGVAFAADHLGRVETHSLAVLDYLRRNYHLDGLRGARRSIERRASTVGGDDPLARLVTPARRPTRRALAEVVGTDRLIALALECDRVAYPHTYAGELGTAATAGGMELTHAAFAIGIARDLGCAAPVTAPVHGAIVDGLHDALAAGPAVDDVSLEQAAMLGYLGVVDRVPPEFVPRIAGAQRDDGGWRAAAADESSWHATALAIWALSAVLSPGAGVPLVARA